MTGEVVLQGVSKVYPASARTRGAAPAVRDVSLRVAPGELLVLVGPSGCGKSTLLRMIAGLETISSGTISIAGRTVNDIEPKDRDVAMVFQNYALYPHMTVAENMGFALRMRGVPKDVRDGKVRQAAENLGLTDMLQRRPGELSGGQRQRVALGRAIVREPKVFLFDEPLSNLDARLRVSTRGEIKALHQRLRITTIYVTHDQEEAMTLGDRIAVMHAGEVRQCQSPLDVYALPADRMVAGFVGTPSMNFVDGIIAKDIAESAFALRVGSHSFALPASVGSAAANRVGQPMVLGIRPTAFSATTVAQSDQGLFVGTVRVIEPLGESTDLHVQTPAGLVIARVQTPPPPLGAHVALTPDPRRVHLFEPGPLGLRCATSVPQQL